MGLYKNKQTNKKCVDDVISLAKLLNTFFDIRLQKIQIKNNENDQQSCLNQSNL